MCHLYLYIYVKLMKYIMYYVIKIFYVSTMFMCTNGFVILIFSFE